MKQHFMRILDTSYKRRAIVILCTVTLLIASAGTLVSCKSSANTAKDITSWLKDNTDIPIYLPISWSPIELGSTKAVENQEYPYYYFELSGDKDSYSINVYRSKEKVNINDEKGYIQNNGDPLSESDYIGSIYGSKITDITESLLNDIPQDAESIELISGLTVYGDEGGGSVWWTDDGWNFELNGMDYGGDTLKEFATAWQEADVTVSNAGKVKMIQGNQTTYYYMWDKDGYRYEFVDRSTAFNETIDVLNSFAQIT